MKYAAWINKFFYQAQSNKLYTPISWIYAVIVGVRAFLYQHGILRIYKAPCCVISVGALEVGGSGKTPITGWLLQTLLQQHVRVGLLTRGYGRTSVGMVLRLPQQPAEAAQLGDEPAMLIAAGLDIPVAAVAKRITGARALYAHGCRCIVLDDGFSHRALQRHIDIVVLRGDMPFGNGALLPCGRLREPITSLQRAHVVWLHFKTSAAPAAVPAWLYALQPKAHWVMSEQHFQCAVNALGHKVVLAGKRVLVATGIALPHIFATNAAQAGAIVCDTITFPDHHMFTSEDVAYLKAKQQHMGAQAVLVTKKDAIKLTSLWADDNLLIFHDDIHICYGLHDLQHVLHATL